MIVKGLLAAHGLGNALPRSADASRCPTSTDMRAEKVRKCSWRKKSCVFMALRAADRPSCDPRRARRSGTRVP